MSFLQILSEEHLSTLFYSWEWGQTWYLQILGNVCIRTWIISVKVVHNPI